MVPCMPVYRPCANRRAVILASTCQVKRIAGLHILEANGMRFTVLDGLPLDAPLASLIQYDFLGGDFASDVFVRVVTVCMCLRLVSAIRALIDVFSMEHEAAYLWRR